MQARLCLIFVGIALTLACSGNAHTDANASGAGAGVGSAGESAGGAGTASDALTAVPAGLSNTLLDGEVVGGLTLTAFTLIQGATGAELFLAVQNQGSTPACEAGITTYFIDKSGQLVETVGSVLQSGRFYRLNSGGLIPCIDPNEVAMAATTNLPTDIVIDDLGYLKHAFPAFSVGDIVPVTGFDVSQVAIVNTVSGSAYTGTLNNGLAVTASAPSVSIFPTNAVGRPLGMVSASSASDLPAGGSWMFQTGTVQDLGVDRAVYPTFNY